MSNSDGRVGGGLGSAANSPQVSEWLEMLNLPRGYTAIRDRSQEKKDGEKGKGNLGV